MTNPKWEVGPVKLVCGYDAIIDAINEDQEDYRYTGRSKRPDGIWSSIGWHANGRYMYAEDGHGFTLAPPPKKKVRVQRWLVVYSDGAACLFVDKGVAEEEAKTNGFAFLELDREVEEGEGL